MTVATVPLGEVTVKLQDGPFGSNLKSSDWVDNGVRVIRLQNIGVGVFVDRDQAFISRNHFDKLRKHECRPGDVLVATLGDPILRAVVQPGSVPVALNKADCIQVRCDPQRASAEYIAHYLNSGRAQAYASVMAHGQTRLRVNLSQLRELPVPLPPIEEQRRIAAVLDAADALRAKRRQALAKLDTLTQAIFVDMFGVESREAGILSRTHPMGVLGDIAEIRSGYGFPHALQGRPDGDYPFAKVGDISALARQGRRDLGSAANFVDQSDLATLKARTFPAGTVAFAKIGEAIRQNFRALATCDLLLDNNVMGLVPAEGTHPAYLFAVMASLDLYPLAQSTTVPSIRKSELARVPVPVPDEDQQRAFVALDDAVQHHRAAIALGTGLLDDLFASLQQRAFRGEL